MEFGTTVGKPSKSVGTAPSSTTCCLNTGRALDWRQKRRFSSLFVGKSLDMVWLAQQGHRIVGLELVDKAVQSFFEEAGMTPEKEMMGGHQRYVCPPFTLIQGDVFALEENTVQADAWYDRAAMIALPADMRDAYVEQLRRQTRAGAVGLLITYAYPQHEMEGPPFALHDEDVKRFFSDGFEVEHLEGMELEDERERGLSSITRACSKSHGFDAKATRFSVPYQVVEVEVQLVLFLHFLRAVHGVALKVRHVFCTRILCGSARRPEGVP